MTQTVDESRTRRARTAASLGLLEAERTARVDRITALAARVFGVEMTTVTVLDGDRATFPLSHGLDPGTAMPRSEVFCDLTQRQGEPMYVEDASLDPRFASWPIVTDAGIRLYGPVRRLHQRRAPGQRHQRVRRARRQAPRHRRHGELAPGDDPYGPYYPGDEAVDWVGLTMLRYGVSQRFGANVQPGSDELGARLDEDFGYGAPGSRTSFYDRFAGSRDQPMLLVTGALYNPGGEGVTEGQVKRTWVKQVADAVRSRPRLRAVVWLEDARFEPEVGRVVRWG